eukprot:scaffold12667_cov108-Cylindrotheca_fusiformis.AAC.1
MSDRFTFPDFIGDTPLDPPALADPSTPAGASQTSYLTAHSGGGLRDLVLVRSSNDLCCGFIGSGNNKICLRKQTDCSVSKHKTSRYVFQEDTLVLRDGPQRGLVDLSIETVNLTSAARVKMTSLNLSLPAWEEVFQVLEALKDDYQPIEEHQIDELLSSLSRTDDDPVLQQTFTVPSERQRDSTSNGNGPPGTGSSGGDVTGGGSHFSFEEIDAFQRSDSTDLEDRMKTVEDHLSQAGTELAKDIVEAGNQIAISRSILEDVLRVIGTTIEAKNIDEVDKKSIWGVLGSLAGAIDTLERQQTQIQKQVSSDLPMQISDLAKLHQDSWNKFSQVFRTIRARDDLVIKDLQTKVKGVDARLTAVETSLAQGTTGPSRSFSSSSSSFGNLFNVAPLGSSAATQSVAATTQGGSGPPSGPPSHGAPHASVSTGPSHSQLATRVANLESTVQTLLAEIAELKKQETLRGTGVIRFESLGFQNEHDAAAFVAANVQDGSLQVGFLFNIYLLCNLVFRMASGDHDFLKLTETINKLDLKSNRAAQAMLAFKSPVPDLFVDGSSSADIWTVTAKDGSYFNRVKSFAEWKKLRLTIRKVATNVETTTKGRLYSNYPKSSRIRSIYEQSITSSVACLIDLVDFMDGVISDMQNFGMSEAKGFALATRLGDAFFRECHKVRAAVADDLEAKDSMKLATTLWYAVTQTLDVMNDFRRQHFKEHSAIASEYIQFIVQTTVREDSGEGIADRLSDLEQKVSDVDKIDKAAKDAKKTADGVKSKMDGVLSKLASATKDAKDATTKSVETLKTKLTDKCSIRALRTRHSDTANRR